jgi:hypothetical protein
MKRSIFLLLFLIPALVQATQITPYEWEKNRKRYTLTPAEQNLAELIIKQHHQYQYTLEDNQFLMYATTHRIVWVGNSEAIQKHNRIYINMNSTLELVDLKARAINKEGKVVLFDKDNIKELKEEESGKAYRIFAIEGVELGSEIEYYYTRKMRGSIYDRLFTQFDAPVKNSSFMLTCPDHLKFDFKSYNGFPTVAQNSENKEVNEYRATATNVAGLKKESFSSYEANRARVEFKLAYNTARSQARLYTWDEAAKTFQGILTEISKNDEKALDKFVKTLGDAAAQKQEVRIKNIENKIKTLIKIDLDRGGEELSTLESILKYKVASRQGATKLFYNVFTKLNIPVHPVITCSREDIKFDGDFDTWAYLDDYVLYFPDTKGFLSPFTYETRYPLIPAEHTAQHGLFLEPFKMGTVSSALASVEYIPAIDYQFNTDNLDIEVSFTEDLEKNKIHQKREFGGYNASFFILSNDLMTRAQQTQMVEEITKQIAPDATLGNWSAKALPEKGVGNFLLDVDYQSTYFLEKAGPRILFKAGTLIGPQVEMYRDDKRVTEIENQYNRGYDRTIRIHIPSGYTVKNPQDLKMNVTYKDGDKTPYLFQSDYALKDNVLEVVIKEYYKEIYAPVSRYEDFRKVINAAADFNKVTLVLEKSK